MLIKSHTFHEFFVFSVFVTSSSIINGLDSICQSMVETKGYICQEHTVKTKDGYILGLQRIPAGRSGKRANKPPVLLQHGLTMDAGTWIMSSPEESFAFILADSGYDVWLANSRGTTSSSRHTSLKSNDPAYWDWSWDELATYDLPATFHHVHSITSQKLHYVGHSLGTLTALATFSQGKLVSMLRSAVLLTPIAYLNHMPSPIARLAARIFLGEKLYWLGLHEFAPKGLAVDKFVKDICIFLGTDCMDLLTVFTGQNCCVNSSVANTFLKHELQPTATKNMIHLAQMVRSGAITKYDYGNEAENMNHYGQPTPPVYDMTRVSKDLPLYLSYGGKDLLSDVNDVQVLLENLKDHDKGKLVVQFRQEYAHMDFILGMNAPQIIYNPIMAFFQLN